MKKLTRYILIFCLISGLSGFSHAKEEKPVKAKNVIYYIGDGMGPQSLGLLVYYARLAPNSIYEDRTSNTEKFLKEAALGLMITNTESTIVTDSAASATQFSSGQYSLPHRVGIDFEGSQTITIMEKAKKRGKSTGLVTTSFLQDATPAAFVAHQISRKNFADISAELINSGTDIMLGGGKKHMSSAELIKAAKDKGYSLAYNKAQINNLSGKIIGLFGEEGTPYAIEGNSEKPNLLEMSKKAIEELRTNKKGFLVMIEAGKIDWAEHSNDPGLILHEMIEFDKTLGYLMEYVKNNKDTILIVTADHETGGFGFNYRNSLPSDNKEGVYGGSYFVTFDILDKLYKQNRSYEDMGNEYAAASQKEKTPSALAKILSQGLGRNISADFVEKYNSDIAKIQAAIAREDGIVFATNAHTSTPVMVMTYGHKMSGYAGLYHTTDLAKKIMFSLGL
ncbi:MAG: alkaline phosphatase [Elusimicrobiota bacterium]|jgi:alkaline phosphatase|nr:alkaline phosphatase [Elusimicrobiota bacterium]